MRLRRALAGAALGLLAAAGGGAAERRPLTADEAAAVRAVGRLDVDGRRFCTATLVSRRHVLTAAHCLFDPKTKARVPDGRLRFVAGRRGEESAAERGVARSAVAPGFVPTATPLPSEIRRDVALLELDRPVPPGKARAIRVGAMPRAAPLRIVSYDRRRSRRPSLTSDCPPRLALAEVVLLGCGIERGASGAPVLAGRGRERRAVAVVSAMGGAPGGARFALAVRVEPWLDDLRAALDAAPR